jgi:hypothetical protein
MFPVGYVSRFELDRTFAERYPIQQADGETKQTNFPSIDPLVLEYSGSLFESSPERSGQRQTPALV